MFLVFLRAPCSEPARESTIFALLVPFLDPRVGAERLVDSEKVIAGFLVRTLNLLASMEVQVVLIAITSLVLVGEPGVERRRLEDFPFFRHLVVLGVRGSSQRYR